jgi:hypothetical protein
VSAPVFPVSFWQYWCLNSGHYACFAGDLPCEPLHQLNITNFGKFYVHCHSVKNFFLETSSTMFHLDMWCDSLNFPAIFLLPLLWPHYYLKAFIVWLLFF